MDGSPIHIIKIKVVQVGALALGGLTAVGTLDAKPAAAATTEDWGFKTIFDVEVGAKLMPSIYTHNMQSSYKTGGRPIFIVFRQKTPSSKM
ncbi:DUF5065 family protein [Bacillus cereus group sp. N12]|uniref:DUF5065 family protein n=1 Tax=Bacillus cereus group sp. N12 TaxID=2794586 RepID=UPI001F5B3B43|nr:DUF5065 family protein [Bacillus cereus group sp. N12]